MYHITVSTDTYDILPTLQGQNPLIDLDHSVNHQHAQRQHLKLRKELSDNVHVQVKTNESIPDFVFIASGGLSLPRLPEPVVILPNMKYTSRKAELPYIKDIFRKLRIQTYEFPGENPFEGEAEVTWFHDFTLLVHAYGYRSNKESVKTLQKLITSIYTSYNVEPPRFIAVPLRSPELYHIDMAMLAYSKDGCIIQKKAFDTRTIERLRKAVGHVTVIHTEDSFALNGIILQNKIITHVQKDPTIKKIVERLSKKQIVEVNLSEFEKAGGAAACLVMEIFDPRSSIK